MYGTAPEQPASEQQSVVEEAPSIFDDAPRGAVQRPHAVAVAEADQAPEPESEPEPVLEPAEAELEPPQPAGPHSLLISLTRGKVLGFGLRLDAAGAVSAFTPALGVPLLARPPIGATITTVDGFPAPPTKRGVGALLKAAKEVVHRRLELETPFEIAREAPKEPAVVLPAPAVEQAREPAPPPPISTAESAAPEVQCGEECASRGPSATSVVRTRHAPTGHRQNTYLHLHDFVTRRLCEPL